MVDLYDGMTTINPGVPTHDLSSFRYTPWYVIRVGGGRPSPPFCRSGAVKMRAVRSGWCGRRSNPDKAGIYSTTRWGGMSGKECAGDLTFQPGQSSGTPLRRLCHVCFGL